MINLQQFGPGELIVKEGDFGENVYIIKEGKVEVYREDESKKIVFGILSESEVFGEMAVIDDRPRSASVRSLENTTLKVLHRDQFLDLLQKDRESSISILQGIFARLREAKIKNNDIIKY